MDIRTGQTTYEMVSSFNSTNLAPITAATFNTIVLKDGSVYSGLTVTSTLVDDSNGLFNFSWSADSIGVYQLRIQNITTNVLYESEIYYVQPDSFFTTNIYVGI